MEIQQSMRPMMAIKAKIPKKMVAGIQFPPISPLFRKKAKAEMPDVEISSRPTFHKIFFMRFFIYNTTGLGIDS